LDDQAPIAMLRNQSLELVQARLLAATRAFIDRDLNG
jgi:hypothetical protein